MPKLNADTAADAPPRVNPGLPAESHYRALRQSPAAGCALRLGAEFHDEDDIRYLLRHLDVQSYDQALELITRYYPLERFPQKTLYALRELLPRAG